MANRFSDYISQETIDIMSPEAKKFIQVLDLLHFEKTLIMDALPRSFNPLTVFRLNFLKKYLMDLGALDLINGVPKSVIEQLILNAAAIYGLKGTTQGLTLFLEILCQGGVLFNSKQLHKAGDFIVPSEINSDQALLRLCYTNTTTQTDEDLQAYADTIADMEESFYFLYSDDSYDSGVSKMKIHIISPFAYIREFRDFLQKILPDYLCMVTPDLSEVSVYLYQHIPANNYFNVPYIQDILQWP